MSIKLFSRAIRSGKTTELYRWRELQPGLAGLLAPDLEGLRYLHLLPGEETLPFQVPNEVDPAPDAIENIGRFRFYRTAFEAAQQHLLRLAAARTTPLVIDEVGPLELGGGGLEPALSQLISQYKHDADLLLVLVVRDTLKETLCQHYSILA